MGMKGEREVPGGGSAADSDDGAGQEDLVPERENRQATRKLHRFGHGRNSVGDWWIRREEKGEKEDGNEGK